MEWVSSKDRMPEDEVECLVLVTWGDYLITYHRDGHWVGFLPDEAVLYWCEIEPPERSGILDVSGILGNAQATPSSASDEK